MENYKHLLLWLGAPRRPWQTHWLFLLLMQALHTYTLWANLSWATKRNVVMINSHAVIASSRTNQHTCCWYTECSLVFCLGNSVQLEKVRRDVYPFFIPWSMWSFFPPSEWSCFILQLHSVGGVLTCFWWRVITFRIFHHSSKWMRGELRKESTRVSKIQFVL